ncbi:conserved unknown protein [Ectocarpus siliculosus]|uniref:Uncharacterized protein n=1 Tax=Ectocarpus siliculosus TaxID=2880 RepID=D7FM70_ECTSI|nr:conserved unknown protein [Ectocarpus siliculosus]|eukprot:CBJ29893.1 conserved unknown protein [Ectocarpus siliculosus]
MKPWKENGTAISSEEVNFLVYRYLQESGFAHSAFTFAYESQITKSSVAEAQVAPGMLITFLQKGLAYVGIEEHLNEDGSESRCDVDFSLLKAHVCGVRRNAVEGGGSGSGKKKRGADDDNDNDNNRRGAGAGGEGFHRGGREGATGGGGGGSAAGDRSHNDDHTGRETNGGADASGRVGGHGHKGAAAGAAAGGANMANTGEAMEVDTGEERGYGEENGGAGAAAAGGVAAGAVAANGEGAMGISIGDGLKGGPAGCDEIPDGDVAVLNNHHSEVFMCAWNPKYDLLASGSGDSTARIWQISPKLRGSKVAEEASRTSMVLKHSKEVGDKNKDVTTLEWNREGTLLATGSYDGVARIWSQDGALQHTLEAHEGPIFSLKWNDKGNFLLSGSSDKSAIVWDVARGDVQQQFRFHEAPTLDVDWKDDLTFATCSTDKAIHTCVIGEEYPRQTFTGHCDEVNAIKWDPSGTFLASCSDDYTAKIWKMGQTSCVHNLEEHDKEIYTIKWSPRPEKKLLLASASFDATVKLWDVHAGKVVSTLQRHQDPVYSVAFSPSGDYLVSGSFAGHLYIWSVKDGTLVKSYQGEGDIFEVAWNFREDRIAACFSTSTVCVMDWRM